MRYLLALEKRRTGSRAGTIARLGLAPVFRFQAIRHKVLNGPTSIPSIVFFDEASGCLFGARFDLDVVVSRQVTLTGNVCKQMRDIAEVWLLRTDVAMKENIVGHQFRGHWQSVERDYGQELPTGVKPLVYGSG